MSTTFMKQTAKIKNTVFSIVIEQLAFSIIIKRLAHADRAIFVQNTSLFTWFISLCAILTGLLLEPANPQSKEIVTLHFCMFLGITTSNLVLLFTLKTRHLYWFYVVDCIAVVIAYNFSARVDIVYADYFLPITAMMLFFGAALLPAFPKATITIATLFWIATTITRYTLPYPREALSSAWASTIIMMLISIGFASLFYFLFNSLSMSVRIQKAQIQELKKTASLLDITLHENQFGLLGFDQNGHKILERGAPISRFMGEEAKSSAASTTQISSTPTTTLQNFKSYFENVQNHSFSDLNNNFVEISNDGQHLLLREHQLENLTLFSFLDVSEMRNIEAKLRETQKLSLIGEITSGVAHNYNNALAIAMANLEAYPKSNNDVLWKTYVEPSLSALDQSIEVSRKLLALAGKQELNPEVFDLSKTVENMRGLFESALGSSIELRIKTQNEILISADRGELESGLLNLVINARNAIKRKNGRITVKTNRQKNYGQVSVEDNGHGIDPSIQHKIFDPFFTNNSTKLSSGLGLAIVKGFVEQSNGYIDLKTNSSGTCFKINFPLANKATLQTINQTKQPSDPVINHSEEQPYILIVDDNLQVAKSFAKLISSLGYNAEFTISPNTAIEKLHNAPENSIAFIDFSMPEMDGITLARSVKDKRPDLSLYMVTGDVRSAKMREENLKDFVDILIKPVRMTELRTLLAQPHQTTKLLANLD